MEKLPGEIHCIIVGFVDVPTLLTCRLVCRAWNKFVGTTLAKVTHVKINQNAIEDSPIANILLGNLYEKRFVCNGDIKLTALHTFIANKCPNVKAYSNISRPRGAYLCELPTGLSYFETKFHKRTTDSFAGFSSLIACDSNFCTSCRLNSSIQYSDNCFDRYDIRSEHPSVDELTTEKLQALKWYDYDESAERQLVRLPNCPSLEILRCTFYFSGSESIRSFSYPNLKYFKCEYLGENFQPLLNSLEHSQQLRAIELVKVPNGTSFLDFIDKLKHLEYLKLSWPDTAEEIIEFTLNNSLKYVSIVTKKPFVFTNKNHERLQILKLECTQPNRRLPIECTFPCLREAYFDFPYTENTSQLIRSLVSSNNLRRLELHFSAYCPRVEASETVRLVGELIHLEYVSISLHLTPRKTEKFQPREVALDLSRHQNLEDVSFKFISSDDSPLIVKMAIGGMDYDHLRLSRTRIKMKKGVYRRWCNINNYYVDLSPGNEGKGENGFFSFEKLDVTLYSSTGREEIEKFTQLMLQMNRLKHLTLSTEIWKIHLEHSKFYLEEIAKVHSLESLELSLLIEVSANGRSEGKIIIDARQLPSLQKLVVKMRSEAMDFTPCHIKLSLLLSDFYNELAFVDENTLEGRLVTGEKLKFVVPKYSEVDFAGPMDQLRSLSITDWNMVKNPKKLFDACKSVELLHMNKGHIRSLIPRLARLDYLNYFTGQLSNTLRRFLTRSKQPRVLNVHSSLRPTIKKIQEKNKSAHSQICYFD